MLLLLRFVHEYGVLYGKNFKTAILRRIGERLHNDGSVNKINFYRSNTYKIVKWILYPILIIFYLLTYT